MLISILLNDWQHGSIYVNVSFNLQLYTICPTSYFYYGNFFREHIQFLKECHNFFQFFFYDKEITEAQVAQQNFSMNRNELKFLVFPLKCPMMLEQIEWVYALLKHTYSLFVTQWLMSCLAGKFNFCTSHCLEISLSVILT